LAVNKTPQTLKIEDGLGVEGNGDMPLFFNKPKPVSLTAC
jgi:hypothetical protein